MTAVARKGTGQYAFYRGTTIVGNPAPGNTPATPTPAISTLSDGPSSLEENLKSLNTSNQVRGIDRLQQRYLNNPSGIRVQEAK